MDAGQTTWAEQPKIGDSDKFFCTGAKVFYDGAPYGGTALLGEAYVDSPMMRSLNMPKDNLGHRIHPDFEQYKNTILKYHRMGCQIQVHCQGDQAIRESLDAFEYAIEQCPRYDARHRLEHCMVMREEDIARAKKLGVSMSYHINHIRFYGEIMRDSVLGKERAENSFALRTAIDMGHRPSLHADCPMFPGDPLSLISTAVTRKTNRGEIIGEAQRITLDEAIRTMTIDAAWQCFMDDKVGSIEVGKLADFVVLSQNPYKVEPEKLTDLRVEDTYLEGRKTVPMPETSCG